MGFRFLSLQLYGVMDLSFRFMMEKKIHVGKYNFFFSEKETPGKRKTFDNATNQKWDINL